VRIWFGSFGGFGQSIFFIFEIYLLFGRLTDIDLANKLKKFSNFEVFNSLLKC